MRPRTLRPLKQSLRRDSTGSDSEHVCSSAAAAKQPDTPSRQRHVRRCPTISFRPPLPAGGFEQLPQIRPQLAEKPRQEQPGAAKLPCYVSGACQGPSTPTKSEWRVRCEMGHEAAPLAAHHADVATQHDAFQLLSNAAFELETTGQPFANNVFLDDVLFDAPGAVRRGTVQEGVVEQHASVKGYMSSLPEASAAQAGSSQPVAPAAGTPPHATSAAVAEAVGAGMPPRPQGFLIDLSSRRGRRAFQLPCCGVRGQQRFSMSN